LVLTIAAGLAAREWLPGAGVRKYAGVVLYAVMMVWLVTLWAPRASPRRAAIIAFLVCAGVELFQATGLPGQIHALLGARSQIAERISRWVLGEHFAAADLLGYLAGALLGGVLAWGVMGRDRRSLDHV
jgi:hypothetical protein